MKKLQYIFLSLACMGIVSCQNKDIEIMDPVIAPIQSEQIQGAPDGVNYTWTWPQQNGTNMQVTILNGSVRISQEVVQGSSFTHSNLESNVTYTYLFKLTDGANYSKGVVKEYTRLGAGSVTGLNMSQVDNPDGTYSALVEWIAPQDATKVDFNAVSGSRNINTQLDASQTSYLIEDVKDGETWIVTITASNDKGGSVPVSNSLTIGKTTVGFLSIYDTAEELIKDGDDDEASAWLWFANEYPTGQFVPFSSIESAETLEPYRVLFWMRDLEDVGEDVVFSMPQVVMSATPAIKEWYANGGNLLLWSHATVYVGTIGRLDTDLLRNNDRAIGAGVGGWNGDVWRMAVALNPGSRFTKDASSHPIFRGLPIENSGDGRTKLIAMKGPGWTEDHNCLFFNIPSVLTGIGNQEEECYNKLVNEYGIIPLATWDSQIDWVSQLNIWEAQKGNTEFNGTILCVGNGGCEFSMKNADGSADKSAYPSNNIYQDNVLRMAKNAIEYLKTR